MVQQVRVQIFGGPPLTVAVWGDDREQADQAIAFQMHDPTRRRGRYPRYRAQSLALRVDQSVGLQPRQPHPTEAVDQFQVLKTALPAVKDYAYRPKAALARRGKHRLEVIILRQLVTGFVVSKC